MRISEIQPSYQQRDAATAPRAREVAADYVPNAAAAAALTRRYTNGLALTETQQQRPVRLSGLGELVQVVT